MASYIPPTEDQVPLFGHRCCRGEGKADQLPAPGLSGENFHRALTDKKGFSMADRPVKPNLTWMAHTIGILSDNDVALFQAQQTLGFNAERPDAKPFACRHEPIPE